MKSAVSPANGRKCAVPLPLWGGVRGGGIPTADVLHPPLPVPPPRRVEDAPPARWGRGRRCRLQQPQGRGADGDDAAAGGARGVEGRGGLGGDLAPLGVHAVLGGVVGLDGQEGAGADVQRDEVAGDAARVERRQQRRREVQAGRRRGHGALAAGVDGLVALGVLRLDGALAGDVGRQRRVAQRRDGLVEIGAVQAEGELHLAGLADVGDGRVEVAEQADAALVAEADAVADGEPLGRPGEGAPAACVDALVQVEGRSAPGSRRAGARPAARRGSRACR